MPRLARVRIGEGRLRLDVGRRQKRRRLVEDAALGNRQDQLFIRFNLHGRYSIG